MKKENIQYELFKKMLAKEIGLDVTDERVPMLMSKLKRAENKLSRMNEDDCNKGSNFVRDGLKTNLQVHVIKLLKKYKTIKVTFNGDPRGGAIRLVFGKTGWINTLGSDVCIDW